MGTYKHLHLHELPLMMSAYITQHTPRLALGVYIYLTHDPRPWVLVSKYCSAQALTTKVSTYWRQLRTVISRPTPRYPTSREETIFAINYCYSLTGNMPISDEAASLLSTQHLLPGRTTREVIILEDFRLFDRIMSIHRIKPHEYTLMVQLAVRAGRNDIVEHLCTHYAYRNIMLYEYIILYSSGLRYGFLRDHFAFAVVICSYNSIKTCIQRKNREMLQEILEILFPTHINHSSIAFALIEYVTNEDTLQEMWNWLNSEGGDPSDMCC